MNPDVKIYFIYATNASKVTLNRSKMTKILQSYHNIHFKYFNIFDYAKGTIMEDFMSTRIWEESEFQQEHLSDILRSLTLNKYGGLYLDLDVIMLKPLRYINLKNFLCKEKTDALASCIYRCNRDEGRVFTEKVLK